MLAPNVSIADVLPKLHSPAPYLAGGIIGAGGELNWPAPMRRGGILHVESEVVEITPSRSKPDRGIAVIVSRTVSQRGEVVQILKAKLVVPRGAAC